MARIAYRLCMPEPHAHLFHVEVRVDHVPGAVELVMPSWTPGSYLMREFPRNVQEFRAESGTGEKLAWSKTDKNSWRIEASQGETLMARYVVYANELTVRTSHLDASHGYVNGASVFMYVRGCENEAVDLRVEPPAGWRVTTPLAEGENLLLFHAKDYHQLVDSPLEIGTHELLEFEAAGRLHRYAIWGHAEYDRERLIADTRRIVETACEFWGDIPYDRYTFFLHVITSGKGGLEHRESCSLQADRGSFGGAGYEQLLGLITHEFFHTWNGTRIRPEPLVSVDYTRENYTRNLWVVEGLTTYYTDLLLLRAGLITRERYLERLGEAIYRLETLPGRRIQSLADSSFDTWIKFYRPDAHTPNSQISYYQKGALVGLLLDFAVRAATRNRHSLYDVMRLLWERYGSRDIGYPEAHTEGFQQVVAEVCGEPFDEFFTAYIFGTEELDYSHYLSFAGLTMLPADHATISGGGALTGSTPAPAHPAAVAAAARTAGAPEHGVRLQQKEGRTVITHVLSGTPAHRAGLNAGDEVLAMNGLRHQSAALLQSWLTTRNPGERIRVAVLRRDELVQTEIELGSPPVPMRRIAPVSSPSPIQSEILRDWLRDPSHAAPDARKLRLDARVNGG